MKNPLDKKYQNHIFRYYDYEQFKPVYYTYWSKNPPTDLNGLDLQRREDFNGAYVPQENQKGIVLAAQEGGAGCSAGRTYIVWIAYTAAGTYERYTA